jgi:hypothetical protein
LHLLLAHLAGLFLQPCLVLNLQALVFLCAFALLERQLLLLLQPVLVLLQQLVLLSHAVLILVVQTLLLVCPVHIAIAGAVHFLLHGAVLLHGALLAALAGRLRATATCPAASLGEGDSRRCEQRYQQDGCCSLRGPLHMALLFASGPDWWPVPGLPPLRSLAFFYAYNLKER